MSQVWISEFLGGAGKVLLHPLFYLSFILCLVIGNTRIKRERQDFHTRVEDLFLELRFLLPAGIVMGLILSLVTVISGLVVPMAAILLIAVLSLVAAATLKVRFLSPAYTVGITFFLLMLLSRETLILPIFKQAFNSIDRSIYPSVAILIGVLITIEGLLIQRNGHKATSPKLIPSKRGSTVGAHESKRLWMVPLFLFVPGGVLEVQFDWWPVFHLGESTFTPILVPFLIGFTQQIQGMLPKDAVRLNGRRVTGLGVIVTLLAIAGYWFDLAAIAAAGAAILGREILYIYQNVSEKKKPFYFSRRSNGLLILGIIPKSPADKMGLSAGEMITKVNGVKIENEQQLYEALQRNGAHCKLEVLDNNAQIRFVQRALYEGEHHELGVLVVQEQRKRQAV
ncbi:PDZ domain-containing protein [Peribacillus deserti]|uniref:PDZ domain-containing protein n=1 Tax=Peribacillus deserti TaxID=673318 RepID=A0A2N5M9V9_9BACI|nr:PDZ domain-containing protein [Peribacillus deserti]PLT31105.1 PDZ domain-containing protein [Peribacillus deserti]